MSTLDIRGVIQSMSCRRGTETSSRDWLSGRCLGGLTNLILDSECQRWGVHVVQVAPHGHVPFDLFRELRHAIRQAHWVESPLFAEEALHHVDFGVSLLVFRLKTLLHEWPTPVRFDADGQHQVLVPSIEEDQCFPREMIRQLSNSLGFRRWMPRLVPVKLTQQSSLPGAM